MAAQANTAAVPVEVPVAPAAPVECRADIRQLLHLVNRLHLLLALAILPQPSLPSTRCRPINNLQTTEIVGPLIAQCRSMSICPRRRIQLCSRILSVGEGIFV